MSASPKAQEPSMEEILASIRRIIAEEEPLPPPERRPPTDPAAYAPRRYAEEAARHEPRGWEGREQDARGADPRVGASRPRDYRQDMRPDVRGEPRPDPRAEGRPADFRGAEGRYYEPAAPEPRGVAEGRRAAPEAMPDPRDSERRVPRGPAPQDYEDERPIMPPRRPSEPRELRENLARPTAPGAAPPSPAGSSAQARPAVTPMRPAPPPADEVASAASGARRKDLLSPMVDAAISASFGSLGDLVLPQQDRTVEDLVKEILRPMLKEWLDKHLPEIVERLVRAEIERVSRAGR